MITKPIFFDRNRVSRVYTGGKLFSGFFGDEAKDGFLPEEWIASNVKAINKDSKDANEGVSKIFGTDIYFDDLLNKYPEELLGKGNNLRILVKALDSAIRLPAQVHPDKEFSKKYFDSEYGKTECWIILDTRPNAKIFFGFKEGVTKEDFECAIDKSKTDKCAMESIMEFITPKKGDVYFVPARTVHAIGKGCLILEVQEPTDFTIQPEHFCGEYELSETEMYMGLPKEIAVSCFDFNKAPEAKISPKILFKSENLIKETIVGPQITDCFIINRIKLTGGEYIANVRNSYAIYIVCNGNGQIIGNEYNKKIKKGDYFFLPANAMGNYKICGNIEIIECY